MDETSSVIRFSHYEETILFSEKSSNRYDGRAYTVDLITRAAVLSNFKWSVMHRTDSVDPGRNNRSVTRCSVGRVAL